jgi:hypothetical protein
MTSTLKHSTYSVLLAAAFTIVGCASTSPVKMTAQSKPGFSNITDIPLPQSATLDSEKSMVLGGNNTWTGHLVYDTDQPNTLITDFTNKKMLEDSWSKISELRGKDTILSYVKDERLATFRISADHGLMSSKTRVSIDMTNTSIKLQKVAVMAPELTADLDACDVNE